MHVYTQLQEDTEGVGKRGEIVSALKNTDGEYLVLLIEKKYHKNNVEVAVCTCISPEMQDFIKLKEVPYYKTVQCENEKHKVLFEDNYCYYTTHELWLGKNFCTTIPNIIEEEPKEPTSEYIQHLKESIKDLEGRNETLICMNKGLRKEEARDKYISNKVQESILKDINIDKLLNELQRRDGPYVLKIEKK